MTIFFAPLWTVAEHLIALVKGLAPHVLENVIRSGDIVKQGQSGYRVPKGMYSVSRVRVSLGHVSAICCFVGDSILREPYGK